jgi:hypothetical protein
LAPFLPLAFSKTQMLSSAKGIFKINFFHKILKIFISYMWFFKKLIWVIIIVAKSRWNYFYPQFYYKSNFTPIQSYCTFVNNILNFVLHYHSTCMVSISLFFFHFFHFETLFTTCAILKNNYYKINNMQVFDCWVWIINLKFSKA